jgi:predicted transposase YdaD
MAKRPKKFDATLKYLWELFPSAGPALLGMSKKGRVDIRDADLSTVTAMADKVFRVRDRSPWLLHVEFLAHHRYRLVRDVVAYNALLDRRHNLPVWSVLVLLQPPADRRSLTGVYRRYRPDGTCYLEFRYTVIRVWQLPVEMLLTGDLGLLPLAVLAQGAAESLRNVIDRMCERVARETTPEVGRELLAASKILLGLHHPEPFLNPLFEGVLNMRESSVYQAILAEGEAKGRAEGKAKGRAEGKAEGRTEEAKKILLQLGQTLFGPPDKSTRSTLERLTDLHRLEQLTARVLQVESWQELLAPPRTRNKNHRRTPGE